MTLQISIRFDLGRHKHKLKRQEDEIKPNAFHLLRGIVSFFDEIVGESLLRPLLDAVGGDFIDDGEEVYLNEDDGYVFASVKKEFGGHECVELHEGRFLFAVDDLQNVDDGFIDEGPEWYIGYIFFFLNCLRKGLSLSLIFTDMRIS